MLPNQHNRTQKERRGKRWEGEGTPLFNVSLYQYRKDEEIPGGRGLGAGLDWVGISSEEKIVLINLRNKKFI